MSTPSPVPNNVSVRLPVGVAAQAKTYDGIPFQPAEVEWCAFITTSGHVQEQVVGVSAPRPDYKFARFYVDLDAIPDWCPPVPAWFAAEVARMRASVDADCHLDKRADLRIDASMGWQ